MVPPGHLAKVHILLMKEFLIHHFEAAFSFQASEVLAIDFSSVTASPFEARLAHPKPVQSLDLKSFMDERTLAREAVDLNLRLMKWRLLPDLDLEAIKASKCLLFGAGTLGCQVARCLIGWGVKHISFVDYSKVSYSNPVRQSLYEFEDTLKGGKPKAETAAEKLTRIYPEIEAKGYSIPVPMPGHFVTREEHIRETLANVDRLEELVQAHDALFLLLDSREARWLPTVLAARLDKLCITVGLGFDSFMVVRHGVAPQLHDPAKHGERLCCYFCNDVVAPQNTMKDRTLDQMCTVTKPGLSFMSAACAAELFVSLLHHPLRHHAPAHEDPALVPTTPLGRLPHHLRGSMSDYSADFFFGRAFDQCVACSSFVQREYAERRNEFLLRIFNDPGYIHDVVGIREQLEQYANLDHGIIEIPEEDVLSELGLAAVDKSCLEPPKAAHEEPSSHSGEAQQSSS